MRKFVSLLSLILCTVLQMRADKVETSFTPPK